jgi:hypothetical protein
VGPASVDATILFRSYICPETSKIDPANRFIKEKFLKIKNKTPVQGMQVISFDLSLELICIV